ncbi:MAG: ABC transporter ATP-binding protein [Acidobacteriia bacterium]|nr:ABC transporter ATP-binding protein [Terriglobia bacterium]
MVEVSGLTKRYGGFTAVGGISFEVRPGECFALLGPNGSGKTTTLKCLAGLALPSAGRVRISGIDLFENPRAAKALLSYLPQRVAFHENLTAREILAFYCRLRALPPERIAAVLEELDLGGFQDKTMGEFSGGMVQRLGIAVALLPEAPLLLLDEPAVSLDPEGAIRFREVLRSLNRAGKTIIFSSHVLADVESLADRVAILVAGRMAAVQSTERIENGLGAAARLHIRLRNPKPQFADVALRAGAADARLLHESLTVSCAPNLRLPVLEALEKAGAGIERFFTGEPSLEDVYLRYVNESAPVDSGGVSGSVRDPSAPAG